MEVLSLNLLCLTEVTGVQAENLNWNIVNSQEEVKLGVQMRSRGSRAGRKRAQAQTAQ